MSRDFDKEPYTREEQRIVKYIDEASNGLVGGGDDPVAFLIASHGALIAARKESIGVVIPGDVVQLDPTQTDNTAFAGCFLTVEEVKTWGIQGFVQALGESRDSIGSRAYYRAEWGTFMKIGKAEWVPKEPVEDNGDDNAGGKTH